MNTEKDLLEKGLYVYPQIGGYLSLKQFIFVETDGKKCLLLRFLNEADFAINAFRFELIQIDAYGKNISSAEVAFGHFTIAPGNMYCPSNGIVVDEKCTDFKIRMICVIAGPYKYVYKNGTVTPYYDPNGYDEETRSRYSVHKPRVKPRFFGGGGFYGFIAFLSLLAVCAACVFGALHEQRQFGRFDDDVKAAYSDASSEKS